jgi:hypothetical protein
MIYTEVGYEYFKRSIKKIASNENSPLPTKPQMNKYLNSM